MTEQIITHFQQHFNTHRPSTFVIIAISICSAVVLGACLYSIIIVL